MSASICCCGSTGFATAIGVGPVQGKRQRPSGAWAKELESMSAAVTTRMRSTSNTKCTGLACATVDIPYASAISCTRTITPKSRRRLLNAFARISDDCRQYRPQNYVDAYEQHKNACSARDRSIRRRVPQPKNNDAAQDCDERTKNQMESGSVEPHTFIHCMRKFKAAMQLPQFRDSH